MKREKTMITLGRERRELGLQPAPKASFKTPVLAALALTLAAGTDRALGDLMALYRFNGSAVADIAGTQKAGAFNGETFDGEGFGTYALDPDVAGGSGGLGSLDLNGGYIDLPTTLSAVNPFRGGGTIGGNMGGSFTITCWFKTTDGGTILSSARNNVWSNHSMSMYVGGDSLVADYYYMNECVQTADADDGEWHFGVMTLNKSINLWTVTLDDGVSTLTMHWDIPDAQDDTIRIGGSMNGTFPTPNAFIGKLSDVAIFNHVLNSTELAAVKAGNFSSFLVPPGAPTSTNDSLTIVEDTPTLLTTSDFGTYSDPYPLAAVKIISLPGAGSLEYDATGSGGWTAVIADQEISAAHITSGRLRYTPAADGSGAPYATINFKVGNGTIFSSYYVLTVTVTPVNDYSPTGADQTVFVPQGGAKNLNAATFGFADADGIDTLQMVKITQLPTAGSLTYIGDPVTLNQEITVVDINDGYLNFIPEPSATGPAYANFGFKVSDGTFYSTSANTITIDLYVLDLGITHSASTIPFDNLGTLVGARVFQYAGTYDGIPFTVWNGPFPSSETIGSGVTAQIIAFSPVAYNLGGADHQYATSLYTYSNDPGALNISGLDAGKTYQVQIAFGDLREGNYPYSVDAAVSLSDGRSGTVPLSIGTAPTGDEYARISATVTGTTSFRLDLPAASSGGGPIIAGFSVHEQDSASYGTWASANGASSNPSDDSNNNGVPNGVEFFMGDTPGNPATLPALVNTTGTWSWTLPYDPTAAASHKFQSSGDLVGWSDALIGEVEFLTAPDRVKFTLPAGTGKKFCRLIVTPTP